MWLVWFFLRLNAKKKGSWQGVQGGGGFLLSVSGRWRAGELAENTEVFSTTLAFHPHVAKLPPRQWFLVRKVPSLML